MTLNEIKGKLVNLKDPDQRFEGFRVRVNYQTQNVLSAKTNRTAEAMAETDGQFSIELTPELERNETIVETKAMEFVVRDKNNDGLTVMTLQVEPSLVTTQTVQGSKNGGGSSTISGGLSGVVGANPNPATLLPTALASGGFVFVTLSFEVEIETVTASPGVIALTPVDPNKKLKGKVVDKNAKLKLRNHQVIIYSNNGANNPNAVLGVCMTDNDGAFSMPYPYGTYKQVWASVSILPTQQIDIALNALDMIPDFLWLVLEGLPETMTQEEQDDCSCHDAHNNTPLLPDMEELVASSQYTQDIGGSCVNFTTPNRALEEYTYTAVVRTSDPELYLPERFKLEDRLEFLNFRISEIQKQIVKFTKPYVVDIADLEYMQEANGGGDEQARTGDPEADDTQASIFPQEDATNDLFKTLLMNASLLTLRKEVQILRAEKERVERLLAGIGRVPLTGRNPIDWDDSDGKISAVQASTIAYGHVLHLRQVWRAAGYSLGDLLYSLPLAPGQKKQIAIMEWDRRETASRSESLDGSESLANDLVHDRDVNEIVKANLSENSSANSHNKTTGKSAGMGVGMGSSTSVGASGSFAGISLLGGMNNMLGVSGGFSKSSGESWSDAAQYSSRNAFASSEQQLRDRTMQNASAVRSQRASVVTTVNQSESFKITTEVIANHNHCHSLTMQYFEVLRHFAVHQELADVQECLFIPFLMEGFDRRKILRWRDILSAYLWAPANQLPALRAGFNALQREEDALKGDTNAYSIFPPGRFADENLQEVFGSLSIQLHVVRPDYLLPTDLSDFNAIKNNILGGFQTSGMGWWPGIQSIAERLARQIFEKTELDRIEENFHKQVAYENFVNDFCQTIKIEAVLKNNVATKINLAFDISIVSNNNWYKNNKSGIDTAISNKLKGQGPSNSRIGDYNITLALSPTSNTYNALSGIRRSDIRSIEVSCNPLPFGSTCMVKSGTINYQTEHSSGKLFSSRTINNDMMGADTALISTPLSQAEMRDPRHEDKRNAALLEQHLETNREYYHKVLWTFLDEQRVFNLLDKHTLQVPHIRYKQYFVQGEAKTGIALNINGKPIIDYETRSVASLVEHKRLGFAGNSVIFPVAKGLNINPNFLLIPNYTKDANDPLLGIIDNVDKVDLIDFYKPEPGTKHEPKPFRISVPTKGLFAEAVSGACNSCEKIDDSRFWKWEEHPIDEPTAIQPISTDSRRADPGDLTAKDFASPIVNIQNAPAAPDPQGLSKILDLIGKGDSFRDLTGLTQTQQNALQALLKNADNALNFSELAASLAKKSGDLSMDAMKTMAGYDIQKRNNTLAGIENLKNSSLDPETKNRLMEKAYEQLFGESGGMNEIIEKVKDAGDNENQNSGKGKYDDALKVLDKVEGSEKVELNSDGSVVVTGYGNPTDDQTEASTLTDVEDFINYLNS